MTKKEALKALERLLKAAEDESLVKLAQKEDDSYQRGAKDSLVAAIAILNAIADLASLKTFRVHWKGGAKTLIQGKDITDALIRAGFADAPDVTKWEEYTPPVSDPNEKFSWKQI